MPTQPENPGLRLLKKGQKGLIHAVFSRLGLIVLLFLLQLVLLFAIFQRFEKFLPHIYGVVVLFIAGMVLWLINNRMDATAKVSWLMLIMLFPVFGALLYGYTQSNLGNRAVRARVNQLLGLTEDAITQQPDALNALKEKNPGAAGLCRYVQRCGCQPVFGRTEVTYFATGEEKWAELLRQLEGAKRFIFLEYFIIEEGLMWGRVLEILARKAAEGVEVRVMYDGTCEFSTLPHDYPKRLHQLGIQCRMFAPLTPFISTHYNYRDHRKILVIDGHTAFNGGVNLADEYINVIKKHGYWKDTAVMLKGEAVKSFTLMFLQMWSITEKEPEFSRFLSMPAPPCEEARGWVMPYGDCPLDENKVGERVYMDILNRAERYVHIMSPYLILDGEMETALRFAAERGVDVSLILPGVPDKKSPYALAKTHYAALLDSGVKIYEYTPGFVHAKVFVSDDREAVVGTINLDYRSLYHHFECATWMYETGCIPDIEADFEATRAQCRPVTRESLRRLPLRQRALGVLLKSVAPLM